MKEKKSFVLYSDLIHTTQLLSNEDTGKVFKWVLDYVNDNDPKPLEGLLSAVCEPIKQQLKRDLIKYEKKREQYSVAGKLSAESRRLKKEKEINERQRTLTNVKERSTKSTVSVNVSVNDNVNDNNIKKERFNSFWKIYPKKRSKKKALESWMKLTDEQINKIALTIKSYAKECKGKEERFIMHPTTYLNGERWEDEIPTEKDLSTETMEERISRLTEEAKQQ